MIFGHYDRTTKLEANTPRGRPNERNLFFPTCGECCLEPEALLKRVFIIFSRFHLPPNSMLYFSSLSSLPFLFSRSLLLLHLDIPLCSRLFIRAQISVSGAWKAGTVTGACARIRVEISRRRRRRWRWNGDSWLGSTAHRAEV